MGDGDDRAVVLVEEALEPVDRLGVEVVRRLVEQQQVRMLEEEPREGDAAPLAAAERGHVLVVRRTAERVHRDVDVALQVPGIGGVDPVLERRLLGADRLVVGVGVGPLGHDGVVLVDEVLDGADAVEDVALDVLRRVELRLLVEVADRESGRQPRVAGEPVVEAGHDPQQARLARAVRPDDADLGARIEAERDVLEDGPVGRVVPGEPVRGVDEFGGHGRQGYGETRQRDRSAPRRRMERYLLRARSRMRFSISETSSSDISSRLTREFLAPRVASINSSWTTFDSRA